MVITNLFILGIIEGIKRGNIIERDNGNDMFGVKRKTKYENRYHKNMGRLKCKVTRIYKTILGIPFKEIYAYRETYYGEVKDLDDCKLNK